MNKSRPLIFLGVGILNTVLDFLFYSLLVFLFFPNNQDIWIVGIISGTFALLCAYTTHKLITWRDHPASRSTLIKFILVTGFGLWLVRPILLTWFISFQGMYSLIQNTLNPVISVPYEFIQSTGAFLMMVIIVMVYNYIAYDKLVFRNKTTYIDPKSDLKS